MIVGVPKEVSSDFHFAADERLTRAVIQSGIAADDARRPDVHRGRHPARLKGPDKAFTDNPGLGLGVNIMRGKVTNQAGGETFGMEVVPVGS